MTHFETIYCTECNTSAVMHADGSVACLCSFVNDPDTDDIPPGWNTTRENIYAMQLAESDYAAALGKHLAEIFEPLGPLCSKSAPPAIQGYERGIIPDREVMVGIPGYLAEVTLGHAWDCGPDLAAPECLHVWHYGFREHVDPGKLAAAARATFAEGPLTLECWPTMASKTEGAIKHLREIYKICTEPGRYDDFAGCRSEEKAKRTLARLREDPLATLAFPEENTGMSARSCVNFCTGWGVMDEYLLSDPRFLTSWTAALEALAVHAA
jgi:hypothetical protein